MANSGNQTASVANTAAKTVTSARDGRATGGSPAFIQIRARTIQMRMARYNKASGRSCIADVSYSLKRLGPLNGNSSTSVRLSGRLRGSRKFSGGAKGDLNRPFAIGKIGLPSSLQSFHAHQPPVTTMPARPANAADSAAAA